jgi:hypothetical protein
MAWMAAHWIRLGGQGWRVGRSGIFFTRTVACGGEGRLARGRFTGERKKYEHVFVSTSYFLGVEIMEKHIEGLACAC